MLLAISNQKDKMNHKNSKDDYNNEINKNKDI